MSACALVFASCETEPALEEAGFLSRSDLEAEGVSGGECMADCGGDSRGEA